MVVPIGGLPVPCNYNARCPSMKKIISAAALSAAALTLATPAAHAAAPNSLQESTVSSATRADGPLGPGLSELVAIAEGILHAYGITK
ncbi:hypothetical protein [Streptomyces collinus]|uniref:hypothetical protein n=1 Tax=Streptomyces collinus TaxID=42684 RepID=UPI003627A787